MENLAGEKEVNGLTQLLAQSDEPAETRKCKVCGEVKSLDDFYQKKGGYYYLDCKSCNKKHSRKWKLENKEKSILTDHKYINSEKGFINETIGGIFSRARRNNKRKKWIPNCTKPDIYDELMLYIQDHGRICEYCKQPWTYIRPIGSRGDKRKKRGSQIDTNFSIDRLDATKTYEVGKESSLVFCCAGCNNRKNQVRLSDIDNIQRVRKERGIK
jgi:hypothetical protein